MWRKAKLRRDLPLSITWDGNSLVAGYLSPVPPSTLVARALTDAGRDLLTRNIGISGQTWQQMDGIGGSADDIRSDCWLPNRTNILIVWETTNAIWNGRTAAQAADDARLYLQHRLAEHPWRIVLLSTLPRFDQSAADQATVDAANARLLAADTIMRANWRAWGVAAFVDVRCPGSPFRLPSFTAADFARDAFPWTDDRVHLTQAGHQVIATMVLAALAALPAR